MIRAPDQGIVKRKWSVEKSAGPLVMLAELLQKRLIQHGWPCEYKRATTVFFPPEENAPTEVTVNSVVFRRYPGRQDFTEAFWDAFDAMLRVICQEKNISAYRDGCILLLDGPHYVNKYGVLKRGNMPPPF